MNLFIRKISDLINSFFINNINQKQFFVVLVSNFFSNVKNKQDLA